MSEASRPDEPLEPSTAPIAGHLLSDTASIMDGELAVGGVAVSDVAAEFGTPVFIYDEDHLRARAREAVAAFGGGAAYATKAFLCKAIASLVASEGMQVDVSTGGELDVVLTAGVDPQRVVFHGNNKSDLEIASALHHGVGRIIVDSFDEIDRLRALRPGADASIRASLRVTPGVNAHTHEFVRTGQEDSKFGFSAASGAAAKALEALRGISWLTVDGVHAHIGSQIFFLEAFEEEVAILGPFLRDNGLAELSVGGGLGVAYLNNERAPSITEWAETIEKACHDAGIPEDVEVGAEPGRAIVATAAMTCYRVGTMKSLPGIRTYVAVDGGMSDNPRPVLYGSGYEAFMPTRPASDRPMAVRVVGKHCESGDVLVSDARVPAELSVGDLLATPVTGAYGYAMASNYNRLPRPAVVFVSSGAARVVIRREQPEDLLRLEP
ncbi:MAG TPA: diaminopimelate decarboxylase [Acidimicrobiales bacterium]